MMATQSGTPLGPYEILSAIGTGGMEEVYRARDPKLGSDADPQPLVGQTQRLAGPRR